MKGYCLFMNELGVSCLRENKKQLILEKFFILAAFTCLFIFFYYVHPIYIYDSDDWTYITYSRQFFPNINEWNPTKILPETLMPLVSELGVRFIYPFTKDYIQSLSWVFAATISTIIMVYINLMINRLKESFEIKGALFLLIGGLFILFHFLPYNINEIQNRHVFYGGNANCYFN